MTLGAGHLPRELDRMVEDGLIEERDAPAGEESFGPKRRYYRRTALGREMARAVSERLRSLLEIAVTQNIIPGVAES